MTTKTKTTKTTYHRDGSVTLWDVYRQQWMRYSAVPDSVLASLCASERWKVMAHTAA